MIVWLTTACNATCVEQGCDWHYFGLQSERDVGERKAVRAAKQHALATGHEVHVERGQVRVF